MAFSALKEVVGSAASHVWFPPPEQEYDGKKDLKFPENLLQIARKFLEKKDLGAGSNWRKEYFRASSNSIMEACTQCTIEI